MSETKLLTGRSNYDVVTSADAFFERQLHAGVYTEHLCQQLAIPLISKTASDLMSKWVGDNEKKIAAIAPGTKSGGS